MAPNILADVVATGAGLPPNIFAVVVDTDGLPNKLALTDVAAVFPNMVAGAAELDGLPNILADIAGTPPNEGIDTARAEVPKVADDAAGVLAPNILGTNGAEVAAPNILADAVTPLTEVAAGIPNILDDEHVTVVLPNTFVELWFPAPKENCAGV